MTIHKNFLNKEWFFAKSFKYILIININEIRQDIYSKKYINNLILMEYTIYDNRRNFLNDLYKQNIFRININSFWIKNLINI